MASVFRNVLEFLDRLGVYDVLLPFILTFAIVFAVMEKTKVLGVEKVDKTEIPRRNINSLVAFCVAFFVVASTQLVAIISQALAHTTLLLLLSVFFLILIGSFQKENKEGVELQGKIWRNGGMILMFIGIVLIFMNAIPTRSGVSWLEYLWAFVVRGWDGTIVGTIVFLIIIIGGIALITRTPKSGGSSSEE